MRATWALEQSVHGDKEIPVLVHGISGVSRTGAYVISSILCKQIRDKGVCSITAACSTVRKYRFGVMRNRLMFGIMMETILNFAADQGMVDRNKPNFKKAIKTIKTMFPNNPNPAPKKEKEKEKEKDKKADDEDEGGDDDD